MRAVPAERRNAATRVCFGIAGVGAFAEACAYTLDLVYQLQTVGLGPLQLVLVGTMLEVVCLLAQVPTGLIADLISRRLVGDHRVRAWSGPARC